MKAKKLISLINEINTEHGGGCVHSLRVVESCDLSEFNKQKSDYTGVEFEYVNQSGCYDYSYCGTIAIPFYDYFIVFDYTE